MDDLIKRFRELFEYDSSSGILTWRVRPRSDFKRKCDHSKFNNKIAGKLIGSRGLFIITTYPKGK